MIFFLSLDCTSSQIKTVLGISAENMKKPVTVSAWRLDTDEYELTQSGCGGVAEKVGWEPFSLCQT